MFMRGSVGIATVILMSGINAEVPSAGLCGPGTVLDGGLVSFFAFLKKISTFLFESLTLQCLQCFFPSILSSVCTPAQPAAYPKVLNPPKFNWESLGGMVFAHTGQAKEYTQNDLQLLSKFSMVQFDKKQSIANMSQSTYVVKSRRIHITLVNTSSQPMVIRNRQRPRDPPPPYLIPSNVVFEHPRIPSSYRQEDRFIQAATQVKAANKDIQIIM